MTCAMGTAAHAEQKLPPAQLYPPATVHTATPAEAPEAPHVLKNLLFSQEPEASVICSPSWWGAIEQRRLLPQEWGHTKPATCSCPSLCEEGTFDLMSTTPANPVQDFCNPEACGYLKTRSYMGAHNCRIEVIYGQH